MSRIEEIKARTAAATPGEWYADSHQLLGWNDEPYTEWGVFVGEEADPRLLFSAFDDVGNIERDVAFIAHSRTDIPYLLERVERLEAALRRHRQGCLNIIEMRGMGNGRYGNLTREEIEEVIREIDSALEQPE